MFQFGRNGRTNASAPVFEFGAVLPRSRSEAMGDWFGRSSSGVTDRFPGMTRRMRSLLARGPGL